MKIKSKDLIGSEIIAQDIRVGKVKEVVVDTETGQVSHLEIELTKDAAEEVLGTKHGGIRNNLAVKAISGSQSDFKAGRIELKISMKQLRIYLSPTD